MRVQELRGFTTRNANIDEAILAAELLKLLANGYEGRKLSIPDWIGEKMQEIEIEINSQVQSERAATLKKLKARRLALSTPDEKRASLDKEILELERITTK